MVNFDEYPKWIKVDGPGHALYPGQVLVETPDQEREALATGRGPDHLNPQPTDAADTKPAPVIAELADKPLADMNRQELVAVLVAETITDEVSDDHLREWIERVRDARSGGLFDHDDDEDEGGAAKPEPLTDAAGAKVPPPQDQEANKGQPGAEEVRTLPEAKVAPAVDGRPEEAQEREPGMKPASDPIAQTLTEPGETKPPEEGGAAKPKAAAKSK